MKKLMILSLFAFSVMSVSNALSANNCLCDLKADGSEVVIAIKDLSPKYQQVACKIACSTAFTANDVKECGKYKIYYRYVSTNGNNLNDQAGAFSKTGCTTGKIKTNEN
jgi:hypothetical protein